MEGKSPSPKHEPVVIAPPIFVVALTDDANDEPGGETEGEFEPASIFLVGRRANGSIMTLTFRNGVTILLF